jgi:mono/diheme cytochrome c family protein
MRVVAAAALTMTAAMAYAQNPPEHFAPERVKVGAGIYAQNCAPCHGPQMKNPEVPIDLRKFPPDQKSRFVTSVTKGKNQMPPWGDIFKGDEIEALWAYVMAGEK